MKENISKRILSLAVLILLLIPIITSSVLDFEQKKANEILLEQKRLEKKAQDLEQKNYLMGKFDPAQREDFILIPEQYTIGQDNNKIYLRKEAYEAYLQMVNIADEDEIDLKIASATRNFDYQRDLWNKKWTGATKVEGKNLSKSMPDGEERFEKILEYSAVPGTSRHHWGTDIDINGVNPPYFNSDKGKREYQWLVENASFFGFCQTYNEKSENRTKGYNEEKWHWSYLPLARVFKEEYKDLVTNEDIEGFLGDEYVPGRDLINNYVLSINPDCI